MKIDKRSLFFCTLLLIIAFGWLIANFPREGLWYDEALTHYVATDSWGTLWAWCTQVDIQVPLHYVALRLWAGLLGDSEFALRLLSVFSVLLASAAMIFIGRKLLGRGAGYAAGALLLFMPGLLWLAYEVRAYAFGLALYAWATAFLVVLITEKTQSPPSSRSLFQSLIPHRYVTAYALLMLGALYTHYTALGALASHVAIFLILIVARRSLPLLRTAITAFVLIGIGFAPWLPILLARGATDRSYYSGSIAPDRSITTMLGFQLLGRDDVPAVYPSLILAFAALILLALIVGIVWKRVRLTALIGFFGVLGPVAITAALVYFRPKLAGRYAWPAWIAVDLLLLILVMLAARWRRELGVVATAALLLIPTLTGERGHPPPSHYREAFAYICANGTPDDVILLRDGTLFVTWEYYGKRPPCEQPRYAVGMPMALITNVDQSLTYPEAHAALQSLIDQRGEIANVWVLSWQGEIMDPQALSYGLLDSNTRAETALLFGDVRVDHYRSVRQLISAPTAIPGPNPIPDAPQVLSTQIFAPQPAKTGDIVVIQAWWKKGINLYPDLRVSVQMTSVDGGWTYAQIDQPPAGWNYYDDRWSADVPALGRYELRIGEDVPAGKVAIRYIIYDALNRWSPIIMNLGEVEVE
ncbi:MAG: hypothetical protein U0528_20835 [Anaerolineae bacterium]